MQAQSYYALAILPGLGYVLRASSEPEIPPSAAPNQVRPCQRRGEQQAAFRKVIIRKYFVLDLAAPDRPFRPGLRVKGVTAHPGVFEMTWDNDGRATFSYGEEGIARQPDFIWRRLGTRAIFTRRPDRSPHNFMR